MAHTNAAAWWKDARLYELYVDKFARNFAGLTERLEYFNFLGVNTLHVLPFYPSPIVDDGYDVSDRRDVRPGLGTLNDFDAFIAAAHACGLRVIIDLVINHVSVKHHWFVEARASKKNAYRDFFLWSDTGDELKNVENPFADFKPSNWVWNPATHDYYYATFYPEQADLNWDNPDVLTAMLEEADFWGGRGVDGFRIDSASRLVKRDGGGSLGLPETHAIIRKIRAHLDKTYGGRIALLAETSESSIDEIKKYFGEGDECQLVYNFPLASRMLLSLGRPEQNLVEQTVAASRGIPPECRWATFLRNHDEINIDSLSPEERREFLDRFDPKRQYPFLNGERAAVRLATALGGDERRILEAFRLLYSLPGAPIMYYGDEIGMQNVPVHAGVKDSRMYVRGDFDWETAERMRQDPDSLLNGVAACIRQGRL